MVNGPREADFYMKARTDFRERGAQRRGSRGRVQVVVERTEPEKSNGTGTKKQKNLGGHDARVGQQTGGAAITGERHERQRKNSRRKGAQLQGGEGIE